MDSTQQQLERIVAYLDGELPPEESAQVEQQLAADEQFRQQLQGAERAWAALDELPMATVGDDFSRTTMEMVVDAARKDVEARTIALPVQRRQRRWKSAVLATLAVLFGALVVRVILQNPNRRLVADLPVIQNIDIYSQFRSVEFLQELNRQLEDSVDVSAVEREQLASELTEFQLVSTVGERAAWLSSLAEDEKVALRTKFNRFRDLSPQRQDELRVLHQQLDASDERAQLATTMYRFQDWLGSLSQSDQFELRDRSADKPSVDFARFVAKRMQEDASRQRFELDPDGLKQLLANVRPHFEELLRKRAAKMSYKERQESRSWSEQRRQGELFLTLTKSPERMDKLNELVTESLPTEMRKDFEELGHWEKGPLVRSWLQQARIQAMGDRRGGKGQRVAEQELADFFVGLPTEEQVELLALPREEMQQRLKRMYLGQMPHRERRMIRPGDDREWDDRPPHGPPPEGRPRDRRGEGRGDGRDDRPRFSSGDGPRRRPRFNDDERGPPRRDARDQPPRRPADNEPSREDSPAID